jgi:hypothetical protein
MVAQLTLKSVKTGVNWGAYNMTFNMIY